MKNFSLYAFSAIFLLFFVGCGSLESVNEINRVYQGTVVKAENIRIADDGVSTTVGSLLGGVTGGALSEGNIWYSIGGAVLGGVLGNQYGESYGQRIDIKIDDSYEVLSVVLEKSNYYYNDRIAIYVNSSGKIIKDERI